MMYRFLIILVLLISGSANAQQIRALSLTVDFMEKLNSEGSKWQVVDNRQYFVPLDTEYQFTMGNFGYIMVAKELEDNLVSIESQFSAFDYRLESFFDHKEVELGAAFFYDSVLVREKSFYRVRITADSLVNGVENCSYQASGSDFLFDPSGDFDFYYVPSTLGDFRWNQVRDAIELDYDNIQNSYNFNDPTKINYYISPCRLSDVGWDDRWDNALDLSRNSLFAHFDHGVNSIYPQTVYMLKMLRLWGYAPSMILEAAASFNENCEYYARKYLKEGKLPKLSELTISSDFRSYDREISSYSAGSFFRYLAGREGLSKFRSLYNRATDLTLKDVFKDIYGVEMSEAEAEWRSVLDTLSTSSGVLNYHYLRIKGLMKFEQQLEFIDYQLKLTADTLHLGHRVANIHFYFGDYLKAERLVRAIIRDDSSTAFHKSYLANLLLAQGKIKDAVTHYQISMKEDTTNYIPYYKLGLIKLNNGANQEAVEFFKIARSKTIAKPIQTDIDIYIGDAYQVMGRSDSSQVYYQLALNQGKMLLRQRSDNPLSMLRVGRAAIRLNEPQVALDHLNKAFFFEERMFYIGQIFVALGQAYDLQGKREEAIENYRHVFEYPTAYLDQQAAEYFLNNPFELK